MPIPKLTIQSFPLGGVDSDGRLRWSKDDTSVRESLLNILLTRPNERIQRPDFGAGVLNFIHQPNNETTRNLIAGVVRKSIQQWETRVLVDGIDVMPSPSHLADVHITVRYRLKHLNQPAELALTLNLGASQ